VPINDNQKFSLKDYRDKLYDEITMKRKITVKKSSSISKYHDDVYIDFISQELDSNMPSPPTKSVSENPENHEHFKH
jgi:hypothetical protein